MRSSIFPSSGNMTSEQHDDLVLKESSLRHTLVLQEIDLTELFFENGLAIRAVEDESFFHSQKTLLSMNPMMFLCDGSDYGTEPHDAPGFLLLLWMPIVNAPDVDNQDLDSLTEAVGVGFGDRSVSKMLGCSGFWVKEVTGCVQCLQPYKDLEQLQNRSTNVGRHGINTHVRLS